MRNKFFTDILLYELYKVVKSLAYTSVTVTIRKALLDVKLNMYD